MTSEDTFDYIIVGAGSAGCVLANRLTESGRHRVLLLEAGGEDTNPWIHVPLGYAKHFVNPKINWLYDTAPNKDWVDRPVMAPRGKVVGGSSSINGMIYIRGQHEDYDHWRQLGNAGWSYQDILPYFRKAENRESGGDEFHGTGGPLHVSDPRETHPLGEAFLEAAKNSGYKTNPDFNGADQEGFGKYQWTIRNGRRHSAAKGYLRPARKRPNLTVATDAHATRLLFEGRRAIGVEYRQGGALRSAMASGEVIVAGGAYNSPQLLQLSGLGPAELLKSYGIEPIADIKGVGADLKDHYNAPIMYKVDKSYSGNDIANHFHRKISAGLNYVLSRRGFLGQAVATYGGFVKTDPIHASPDIQILLMLFSTDRAGPTAHPFPGITLTATLLRPESKGHVRIVSPDPFAAPEIQPNYMAEEKDRTSLIAAVRAMRHLMQDPVISHYLISEYAPGTDIVTDDQIVEFLKEKGRTSFHPVSTCRMGNDANAVVDERLRVRGFEALRVIDASIMPDLVSGNTNAPTIMIAEKGADMLLEDARL
jgi:choline dehydrogenase